MPLCNNVKNESIPHVSIYLQEPLFINVELLENHSLNWFRARLLINVSTDIPINMSYVFSGIGDSEGLIPEVNSSVFVISNESSQIEVFIQPVWSAFPRTFHYQFSLFYINITTQIPQIIYDIPQGIFTIIMGVPTSLIIGGLFIIGLIIITTRSVKVRKNKVTQTVESSESITFSETPSPPSTNIVGGLIVCPECKKKIAEGSAFCPECGYHIPRFLRT